MSMKTTTNYNMFTLDQENRDVNLDDKETKNLAEMMVEYGWLDAFPLWAIKRGKKLIVQDGQHRLAIAREFGIPVKYVVTENGGAIPDVADIQKTQKKWKPIDYAMRYAKAGNDHYAELIDFHYKYGIPIGLSAAILANTSSFGNVSDRFHSGRYQIRSRKLALHLAETRRKLMDVSKSFKKAPAVTALWACFHVQYFEPSRLVSGATRHGGAIKNMGNTQAFLEMFEELYNFGRKQRLPLKFDASEAMNERLARFSKKETANA